MTSDFRGYWQLSWGYLATVYGIYGGCIRIDPATNLLYWRRLRRTCHKRQKGIPTSTASFHSALFKFQFQRQHRFKISWIYQLISKRTVSNALNICYPLRQPYHWCLCCGNSSHFEMEVPELGEPRGWGRLFFVSEPICFPFCNLARWIARRLRFLVV